MRANSSKPFDISLTTLRTPETSAQQASAMSATNEENVDASPQKPMPNPNPLAQRHRAMQFMEPIPGSGDGVDASSPTESSPQEKTELAKTFVKTLSEPSAPASDKLADATELEDLGFSALMKKWEGKQEKLQGDSDAWSLMAQKDREASE